MVRIVDLNDIPFDRNLLLQVTRFFSDQIGTTLLYSGTNSEYSARSFLCLFPYEYIWIQGDKQWNSSPLGERHLVFHEANPWDALKKMMSRRDIQHPYPDHVGFIGYEMGAFSDPEKLLPYNPSHTPDAFFQRCSLVVVVDHIANSAQLIFSDKGEYFIDTESRRWLEYLSYAGNWPEFIKTISEENTSYGPEDSLQLTPPKDTLETYSDKVNQAKEWIKNGDIYQINLSQQFEIQGRRHSFQVFENLVNLNPSPFAAYMKMKDYAIVSSSPESFLRKRLDSLETRPIKGTIQRGKTPEEDQKNRENLLNSSKERAELVMIADLMRNDLGKISHPGSVQTEEIWGCEAYTNVYHLVSTIRSRPLPGQHEVDLIRACFPGGSITGCPKLRAMERIAELEKRPRGIYTGSIGYFAANGDFDFNIAIRTLTLRNNIINVQLGGAVVADSDPEKEYAETLHKGASIFKVLGINP